MTASELEAASAAILTRAQQLWEEEGKTIDAGAERGPRNATTPEKFLERALAETSPSLVRQLLELWREQVSPEDLDEELNARQEQLTRHSFATS